MTALDERLPVDSEQPVLPPITPHSPFDSPETQAVLRRLAGIDPLSLIDEDLFRDILDETANRSSHYVTARQLNTDLGLGDTFEHELWGLVETYSRLIADASLNLGFRACASLVAQRPLRRRDHEAAVEDVVARDAAVRKMAAEHTARWQAEQGVGPWDEEHARETGHEPFCAQHASDPSGTWHTARPVTVVVKGHPATHEAGDVTIALSRWEKDSLKAPETIEVQWPENTGCASTTLLSLDDALRLGELLIAQVRTAYDSQHIRAARQAKR